jgi:DNA-binding response OmpR family regulator
VYRKDHSAMSRTIMVVDDDQDTVEILQLYLEHEGYRSVVAVDGVEALKSVKDVNPDLIILDLMLPKLDGLEVCRCIRAESQTPIVVLTAGEEEDSRWDRFSLGVDDYISKPFSPKELMARVKSLLADTARPG